MTKQNWEKEFDSKWYLWDYSKKLNTYNTCGEAVKSFIRQLLAEQEENWQKELAEKIEGMKYFIPVTKGLTILEYQREMKGYKRALTEVLKKLENGK